MKKSTAIFITAALGLLALCTAATSNLTVRSRGTTQKRVFSLFPLLADPVKFNGKQIELEAFVASAEGHYVLAPTLSCIANSAGPSLVNLEISKCRGKEKLSNLNPGICSLTGVVDTDELGSPPTMAFSFFATECKSAVRVR